MKTILDYIEVYSNLSKNIQGYIGSTLVAVGIAVILIAIATAITSFYDYRIPEISGSTLDDVLVKLVGILVDVAIRLGFLGVIVWAGSILLKYGIPLIKPEGKLKE